MKEFRENFNTEFIGNIPCVAYIINLVVNDIMTALKINAPKSEELEGLIDEIKKLSKKKG